jgi:hypothetical protein
VIFVADYDTFQLTKSNLIVCEGADDKEYLTTFLNSLNNNYTDKFQLYSVNGISKFPSFFALLPRVRKFNTLLKTVIIVRDSESDPLKAKDSITTFLKKNNFVVPSGPCCIAEPDIDKGENNVKIGYTLFPNFDLCTPGTIEDLCINTLSFPKSTELLEIVDNALDKAKQILNIEKYKKLHKNRLHTYLSITDKYVSMKLGIAANSNAFDFSSKILKPFIDMIFQSLSDT